MRPWLAGTDTAADTNPHPTTTEIPSVQCASKLESHRIRASRGRTFEQLAYCLLRPHSASGTGCGAV